MKQFRKRHKSWHNDAVSSQVNHFAQVSQEKQDSEDATSGKWRTESSERVFSDSQEKLKKSWEQENSEILKKSITFRILMIVTKRRKKA
ncbi:hypothetical protein ABFA07_020374 [Porites harrisoni]